MKEIAVVTGANGFVGSHLVDILLEKNYHVRCVTRRTSNLRWLDGKNVEIFDCGLNNKNALKNAFQDSEYIFHAAGVVKSKKPEGYFEGNVDTTRTLLETALEFTDSIKRFLVVSSLTACGPSLNGKPVTEESECNPITTYGKSKLAEEKIALSFKDKFPVTICRAPAVYGERDTEIFIFFQTFNKGLMTSIGFRDKRVSLIHVRDLVEGFLLAAQSPKAEGETYFISSEKYCTWGEVGRITSKVMGKNPIKIKVPHSAVYSIAAIAQFFSLFSSKAATLNIEKAKDITQLAWICDTGKAMRDMGYRQKISLEEGIRRTVDWYKKNKWL